MTNPLEDLLQLQAIDTRLDQLRHRRSHLPALSELAAIESSLSDLADQRAKVGAELEEVAGRQAVAEAEMETAEARAATLNQRMYGGEVSAIKDLQAMSEEVEHLKSRVSAFEDSILALMEELEPTETRLAELSGSAEHLEAQRVEVAARLAAAQMALDAEIAGAETERGEAAASLAAPLLSTYDRLREHLGGIGVARLVGSHCDGCHLTLPSAELDRVRHLPEGELYFCEQCSRILVPSPAGPAGA